MSGRTQVNLQVSPKQKREWEQAAKDEPEYQNLSHLIRMSVSKELSDSNQQQVDSGQEMSRVLERLDTLEHMQRQLNSIDGRLRDVESEVRHDPEVSKIASDVFGLLPTVKPGTRKWQDEMDNRRFQLQAAEDGQEPDVDGSKRLVEGWTGTVEGLATAIDKPTHVVREALEKLMRDTHQLKQTDDGRYYRRK